MEKKTGPRDLGNLVNEGMSALVFGVGYRVGIVDQFMKTKQPCTAAELAQNAGMKVRYVQEWLNCMVAAGIVTVHEGDRFELPYDEQALRTHGHGATILPILSNMIPKLEQVLPKDGPRGYGYWEPFLEWWGEYHKPEDIKVWIQEQLVPVLQLKPCKNFKLLDLGCGYGRYTLMIAKAYPDCKIYGIDPDKESIDHSIAELAKEGLTNVQFLCLSGAELPKDWSEMFDFIILNDVLHDAYEVEGILEETKRVLKSDGLGAAYDPPVSSYPANLTHDYMARLFLPLSMFSCLPKSLSGPSGEGYGVGWGYEKRRAAIEKHGLGLVKVGDLDLNTVQERIVFKK